MIWEFHQYENEHGESSVALDVNFGGRGRTFLFHNDPKKQRKCKCRNCGTEIPREVPRIKLVASYHYEAGYRCLSCGIRELKDRQNNLNGAVKVIQKEIGNLDKIMDISVKVMQDKFYSERMAVARLCQVVAGEDTK